MFDLWVKPQTNGCHEFNFIVLFLVAVKLFAIALDEGRLSEEAVLTPESRGRELPEWLLLEQTTLECARENPSDLGTKIPESEARSDRVSRLGIVTGTSRFAVLWMTRAEWNCLGVICELKRADSASDEVIVSGYWSKRWNGESDWNGGNDWISLHIRDECWSRRSSRGNDVGLACGHEQIQRVGNRGPEPKCSRAPEIRRTKRVRQVDWRMLSAHRWVRQSASHSGSTPHPQVTDQSLFDEHE